jgi:hypothetical protein
MKTFIDKALKKLETIRNHLCYSLLSLKDFLGNQRF